MNFCRGEDLCDNWNKKLCNRMIKPTGKPGLIRDRIFRCIPIKRRIMEKANAAILGVDSAESGHSGDDGDSAFSDVMEGGAEAADGGVAFQFSGGYEEGGEEDEEVAAATNADIAEEEQGGSPRQCCLVFSQPSSVIARLRQRWSVQRGTRQCCLIFSQPGGAGSQKCGTNTKEESDDLVVQQRRRRGGGAEEKPRIQPTANGGRSLRPWKGWRN